MSRREFILTFNDLCYDPAPDCVVTVDPGTDANVNPNEVIRVVEHSALTEALAQAEMLADCLKYAKNLHFADWRVWADAALIKYNQFKKGEG